MRAMPAPRPRFPAAPISIEAIYEDLETLAPKFEALAREAETERQPPDALAALIRKARIPMAKVPEVLGGCELSPGAQVDFFARIAYLNPTAGWLAFNQSGVLGLIGANMSEEGLDQVFAGDQCPLAAAVSAQGSALRDARKTWAPASANPKAIWRPIPRPPPVTSADC